MNEKEISKIPSFVSEDEEREFWATHDSTGFVDWREAVRRSFPNLPRSASPGSRGLSIADFRDFVETTFRPKINILVLDVFFDDPSGETQRVPIENIADIIPDSWLFLAYKAEEISTNQIIEGLVRLLYSADGELFEIVWFPPPNSPLARLFVDMAKEAFSAAMQQSLSV